MVRFTNVELADFDDQQIEKFINNWFKSDPEDAKDCWAKLSKPEYKASKELAQTPLLLTFLCLAYGNYGDFPAQRSQLYSQALEILLYKWDREKKLKRDKIYRDWSPNLEVTLLSEFAFDFFKDDQLFFKKQNILEYLEIFLDNTEGDSQYINVDAVLDAIAVQQGIFVERATDIYSFSHLTLQEYLAAKHISQKDSRIYKLVTEHLTDKRWKEVFLLVAGEKNDADQLLELMAESTYKLINTPKLENLLQWVERITDPTDSDFKYLGKRALANANAFAFANANANAFAFAFATAIANAHANAHAIANAIANAIAIAFAFAFAFANAQRAIDHFLSYISWAKKCQIYRDVDYSSLTNQLENLKQEIPNEQASKSERKAFVDKLLETWFTAFHTTSETMKLTIDEVETLDNYLYANRLIIECKNAAVRVSQKTWQKIEAEM